MIVQQRDVKGGIAAVTNGYYGSSLEDAFDICYVESYCDGSPFKKILKALKGYSRFRRVLSDFKPDLVHIHSSFGPSFYRMQPFLNMAARRKIPVVDHCHGADFDTFFVNASEKKKKRIKEVYGRFAKVIVLSEEWKEKFLNVLPEDKLTVIQNYCRPKDISALEPVFEKRYEGKQVVFLGELGRRKGGYDLADIIKKTCDAVPGARFVLCGDGRKEDVDAIKLMVAETCKPGSFSFPGWVRNEEKDRILMESAVFILPSYQEGQPMSILDAMAYGLPIVSTEIGGIPQQVVDGKSGFLVKPGDTAKTAEKIAALLTDRELFESASRESLGIADKKYGFEAHVQKIAQIYDSLT